MRKKKKSVKPLPKKAAKKATRRPKMRPISSVEANTTVDYQWHPIRSAMGHGYSD
jgi:hypothetical protein